MITFATEFPVKTTLDRTALLSQVMSWLRGTKYSTVFDKDHKADIDNEAAHLRSQSGEELRLREFDYKHVSDVIGFRHDFPDKEGRLWRTEAVVRRDVCNEGRSLLRLRTQCIAREPTARLEIPRKPYLVKTLLQDGWGGKDGILDVNDRPLWLADDEPSLQAAQSITSGKASRYLPIIFISASGASQWQLTRKEIEKLAYDLGGVAHVVVEPSRTFSFLLRDATSGANAYGGSLGIVLPKRGIVRRLHLGWRSQNSAELLSAAKAAAVAIRSQMPAEGWDWTELQEQALRRQRERDRNRLSSTENENLYLEEIENLKERVNELENQLLERPISEASTSDDGGILHFLANADLGREIYPNEFSDRLRWAAKLVCDQSEQIGLDIRTKSVLGAIISKLPPSPALGELLEDLKRATRDSKRVASELNTLLCRHGYRKKSDNKHIRLEAESGYAGLSSITIPTTPSDHRGLTNLRKQIERTLGITKLAE